MKPSRTRPRVTRPRTTRMTCQFRGRVGAKARDSQTLEKPKLLIYCNLLASFCRKKPSQSRFHRVLLHYTRSRKTASGDRDGNASVSWQSPTAAPAAVAALPTRTILFRRADELRGCGGRAHGARSDQAKGFARLLARVYRASWGRPGCARDDRSHGARDY